MKVVVYGIQACERKFLATANQKKHHITLIANPLTEETMFYAAGKEAVIVTANLPVSAKMAIQLTQMGISHLLTRALCTDESEARVLQAMATLVIGQLDELENNDEHHDPR